MGDPEPPLDVAAALARLGPVREQVASAVERAAGGKTAWLVGGVVRDALLGRPLYDLDIVVDDDCRGAATAIAASIGGSAFSLSDRWGCWRVVAARDGDDTDRQVDVCVRRGEGIVDDLGERDFTVNAMAVPCIGDAELVDPFDGVGDLQRRQLRTVSDRVFDDDPLRLLRLARMSHLLSLEPEAATVELARSRAHLASEPSGERIFSEVCGIVEGPEARRGIRTLDALGLVDSVLPELAACRGIEQSRFHHLDVFEHTLAVLDNAEDILADPAHYLGTPAHVPAEPFPADRRRIALFGALFHDLGKPATHTVDPGTGRVRFIGHDRTGLPIVDTICDRWSTSNSFRDGAKLLVRTHLALGMLLHGEIDARATWRFLRAVEPCAGEAIVLSLADRYATGGIDDRRSWRRAHAAAARHLWAAHWQEAAEGKPGPLLDGSEIVALTGAEGPAIGTAVRQLAEEQAAGTVTTREQAVAFLQALS